MEQGIIYLAAGCFWGAQRFFDRLSGVLSTEVGYANGRTPDPTYKEVKSGRTGYAETVKIIYDKSKISLYEILGLYFKIIDPLSVNRQGGDEGEQYRTGIYYENSEDLAAIKSVYSSEERRIGSRLAVEIGPLERFYPAEEYHQKYLDKNSGGYCHISPEMIKIAEEYIPKAGNRLFHGFPAFINKDSEILILGSFPSVKSREEGVYYAHPQNRFWKILSIIFDDLPPASVSEKKAFLLAHKIALWDVIESCEAVGSSDSSIKNVTPADIPGLVAGSKIKMVLLNGRTAEKYFKKYFPDFPVSAKVLPSTSPANAAWSIERLAEAWGRAMG